MNPFKMMMMMEETKTIFQINAYRFLISISLAIENGKEKHSFRYAIYLSLFVFSIQDSFYNSIETISYDRNSRFDCVLMLRKKTDE